MKKVLFLERNKEIRYKKPNTCTSQSGDDKSFTIASRPPCSKISTLQENSAVEQD